MLKRIFTSSFFLVVLLSACTKEDTAEEEKSDGFDRSAMLINIADNSIIPAYTELDIALRGLQEAKNEFINNADEKSLANVRSNWINAYQIWQHVEMFNIGKAEQVFYNYQMNIYPTNVDDIEKNIATAAYDLSIPDNNDAVGFPALDYLLYGLEESDTELLIKYTGDATAKAYQTYLSDVVDQMVSLTGIVLSDWKNGYRDTFVADVSNTATSALNKFTNDYIFYYEKGLRANKIGIPAGVFSNDPLPNHVEGLYNKDVSKLLSLEALAAVTNIFEGIHFKKNTKGSSFGDYLIHLGKGALKTKISEQLALSKDKVEILDSNFNSQITIDNKKMTGAYDALQRGIVLLKVDMLQTLNVSIDYIDADGD